MTEQLESRVTSGWFVFAAATIAVFLAASALLAQPATTAPAEPVPVKVVQPVPTNDTTLAAVWMAAVSGMLALGSAGLQAYTARRAAADRMQFDAQLVRLQAVNDAMKEETKHCEERSAVLERELVDVRARLAVAEAEIKRLKGG